MVLFLLGATVGAGAMWLACWWERERVKLKRFKRQVRDPERTEQVPVTWYREEIKKTEKKP